MQSILYLSATDQVGGAEESLLLLLENLERSRFSPHLVVPEYSPRTNEAGEQPSVARLSMRAKAAGIPVHPLPLPQLRHLWNPLALLPRWRGISRARAAVGLLATEKKIAVIHANTLTAGIFATAAPSSLVCHFRDHQFPSCTVEAVRPRLARAIAPSTYLAARAEQYFEASIHRIYNPLNLDLFQPPETVQDDRPTTTAPLLLMVAHLAPWKRHARFLHCLTLVRREFPQARGMIIGRDLSGVHAKYKARLLRLAGSLNLLDALEWKDSATQGQVARWMKAAAVLVHPAEPEPFGRVVAEAMACGLPTVAIKRGGPAELLQKNRGILVSSENNAAQIIQDLAAGVLRYLPTPALTVCDAALEFARQNFSPAAHARAVERVYSGLRRSPLPRLSAP